jgi:hypothetical protein
VTTATKLTKAREALAELEHKITELTTARDRRLLDGDAAAAVAKVEDEIAAAQRAARTETDRIALLITALAAEEQEALAKRRAHLRDRFAKRMAEADVVADDVQKTVALLVQQFRRLVTLRETARAAWPLADSSSNAAAGAHDGAALSGAAVKFLLAAEFFRQSADPFMGGAPGEVRKQSLPGSQCPDLRFQLQPERLVSFSDVLKRASAFAVSQMSTVLDPLRAMPGAAIAPQEGSPRTDAERELAALLRDQAAASTDTSEAGERRYMEIVAKIAALTPEVQTGATKQ